MSFLWGPGRGPRPSIGWKNGEEFNPWLMYNYHLVIQHSHGKSEFLIGKPSIDGPFSMAMLVITRGYIGYIMDMGQSRNGNTKIQWWRQKWSTDISFPGMAKTCKNLNYWDHQPAVFGDVSTWLSFLWSPSSDRSEQHDAAWLCADMHSGTYHDI